jgi:hypothetical protein
MLHRLFINGNNKNKNLTDLNHIQEVNYGPQQAPDIRYYLDSHDNAVIDDSQTASSSS